MLEALGFIGISPGGAHWFIASAVLLALDMAVSTCRRMLGSFSRKALLEGVKEPRRAKLLALLPLVDDYRGALRALDQALRLAFFACLAFAVLYRREEPRSPAAEALAFVVFLGALCSMVVFCLELWPSAFARIRTEASVRFLLPLLAGIFPLLRPLLRLYQRAVRAGARAVGGEEERAGAAVAEEGILTAMAEGEREGFLEQRERSMIESIIRFRDREVSEVMTPRTEMVCLDIEESVEESVRVAIECGHSRIPVYRENKDNIAGILYVKDLLRFWNECREVRLCDIIRQAHFVPESKKISELLHEFKSQRFHIAIILDEFGGTAGLVTIEDIIEEIVGEIVDEFEKEGRPDYLVVAPRVVEVHARLPIHELNQRLEVELPEQDGYDTVGGFLITAMGRIPEVGDSYLSGRIRFEVLEADQRKINRIRIRIIADGVPTEGGGGSRKGSAAGRTEAEQGAAGPAVAHPPGADAGVRAKEPWRK